MQCRPHLPHALPVRRSSSPRFPGIPTGFALLIFCLAAGSIAASATAASPLLIAPLTIEVAIPQVGPLPDLSPELEEANAFIRARALAMVEELAQYGNVWGEYEVHVDEAGVGSATMLYSGYAPPMAHPMHLRTSVTWDWETGRVYSLADLFTGEDYVEVLSRAVADRLTQEADLPLLVEFTGIRPDQDFYLTPTELVLYFQLYELLPYAAGFPEFPIPYRDVAALVDPEGPIGKLMRNRP